MTKWKLGYEGLNYKQDVEASVQINASVLRGVFYCWRKVL